LWIGERETGRIAKTGLSSGGVAMGGRRKKGKFKPSKTNRTQLRPPKRRISSNPSGLSRSKREGKGGVGYYMFIMGMGEVGKGG